MKTKFTLKSLLVITCLLLSISVYAQIPPITLHVETAGTLKTLLGAGVNAIEDLTLTGDLNGTDISTIRDMSKLSILDMTGTNIVAGGSTYYQNYSTGNNVFPAYMFYNRTKALSIKLPNSVTTIDAFAFDGCTGLTSITIPNSVTSIRNFAFRGCTGLTNVTIGNSVNSIENYAFSECTGLTNVTIGNSVNSIGSGAFYQCTGLTNVTIGNSVNSIGSQAFFQCTGLTNVTIPNSVTSIGVHAFRGCTGLKEFIVSEQNQKYSSAEGVLFDKEKTTIINCPMGKQGSHYVIPNSVTLIENHAFYICKGLTNVTIGNSVISIGRDAFRGCTGLTSITIPNSVTSIGDEAFYGCTGLTNVTIGNSVNSIGSDAFYRCTGLTNVTIGNSVTMIGDRAFSGCTGLTEIHCKNPQPLTINVSVFNNVNKTTCKLYVPKGSYIAYWLAYVWSGFKNIIEEDATAIQTINKDIASIHFISNGIYIDTKETASIVVYNLSGQIVYQDVVNGNVEISLNKGVYIVRANNESQKVIVK